MHLRRHNRHQEKPQDFEFSEPKAPVKAEPAFDWSRITLPKEVREWAAQRKALANKMTEIENRLRFGYSEPLYQYKMDLIKEDVELSCKMTEVLIK